MTEPTTPPLPKRVTIDSLRAGAQFTAADGVHCTYERRDGANSGAHHVRRSDGSATLYAGCALVTLGWNERAQLLLYDAGLLHDCGVSSTRVHRRLVAELEAQRQGQ